MLANHLYLLLPTDFYTGLQRGIKNLANLIHRRRLMQMLDYTDIHSSASRYVIRDSSKKLNSLNRKFK